MSTNIVSRKHQLNLHTICSFQSYTVRCILQVQKHEVVDGPAVVVPPELWELRHGLRQSYVIIVVCAQRHSRHHKQLDASSRIEVDSFERYQDVHQQVYEHISGELSQNRANTNERK